MHQAFQNLEGGEDKFYLGDSTFGYKEGFKKSSWRKPLERKAYEDLEGRTAVWHIDNTNSSVFCFVSFHVFNFI